MERSLEREPQGSEINISLMTLLGQSTIYTLFWPAERFAREVGAADYKGLEWHPIRLGVAGIQTTHFPTFLDSATRDSIRSFHQSWRSERSILESWRHPNRGLALFSYVCLPYRPDSLSSLQKLQKAVGRELSVVLYEHKEDVAAAISHGFGERLIQPTAALLEKWGLAQWWAEARSTEEKVNKFIREANRREYTGLCLDTLHYRRRHGELSLPCWQEALSIMVEKDVIKEIHVGAGRTDIPSVDSSAELKDLLNGTEKTELINMLKMFRELGWQGRVVTEIPAESLAMVRGGGRFLTPDELANDHKRIVASVVGHLI